MNYHNKKFENRDEHLKVHTISTEISAILEIKEKTQPHNIAAEQILKILNQQNKDVLNKVIHYEDCWLLSVAAFYQNIEAAKLFLDLGANTKKLNNQLKNTERYEECHSIINKITILETHINLEKNIPINNKTVSKIPKF